MKSKKNQTRILCLMACFAILAAAVASVSGQKCCSLKVTSFPAGAEVTIDGTDSGKVTPMSASLTVGDHTIVVSVPGSDWAPVSRTVTIVTGMNEVSFTLLPASPVKQNVIGAWFGIARPCPANPTTDSTDHAAFCTAVCGLCPNSGILPPEFNFTATLHPDGTTTEEDALQIGLYHTGAQGAWAISQNDGLADRVGTQRIKATYLWMGQTPPAFGLLGNAVRTRLVTYSDPLDPDRMLGYIQPYFYPVATGGLIVVNPATDPLDGNHIPTIDPLQSPLPAGCDLTKGCLGTYHFVIRRIKEQ